MTSASHTIADALRFGKQRLTQAGIDTPGLDAEVVLRHVLGFDRTQLFVRLREPIAADILATYLRVLDQRATGQPVAYLTGEREFMGLLFAVGPEVLVPRPETEILVEWALRWLGDRQNAAIVDVGTGSGAIALSLAALAARGAVKTVTAIDVSDAALRTADRNRTRLGLRNRVSLVQGSLLGPISSPVDLVLANLPYLRPQQIANNRQLGAEPRLALDGGNDGLDLVRRLLLDAPRVVKPGGAVGLEIDPSQSDTVVSLGRRAFPGADIAVLPDLAGFDRHVIIEAR